MNAKGYLPKERVENGLRPRARLINRNENWRNDMSSYYRGAKINPVKQPNERRNAQVGLYRGVQYTVWRGLPVRSATCAVAAGRCAVRCSRRLFLGAEKGGPNQPVSGLSGGLRLVCSASRIRTRAVNYEV